MTKLYATDFIKLLLTHRFDTLTTVVVRTIPLHIDGISNVLVLYPLTISF